MATKPICVIYFPDLFDGGRDRNWIYEYMRYLNGEQSDGSMKWVERTEYWNQYYWFCFYKDGISEPEFKVFYEKDFTETSYTELKQLIEESLNQNKSK